MKIKNLLISCSLVFAFSSLLINYVVAAPLPYSIIAQGNGHIMLPDGKFVDNTGTVVLQIGFDLPHKGGVDAIVLEFNQGTASEERAIWEIWSTKTYTIEGSKTVTVYKAKPPAVPEGTNHDNKGDLFGPVVVTIIDNSQVRLVGAHNTYFEGSIITP